MKYRLLMLSPEFVADALPETVREDVAQAYRVIEYETAEELAALLQEAVKLLAEDLPHDEPASTPPSQGSQGPGWAPGDDPSAGVYQG